MRNPAVLRRGKLLDYMLHLQPNIGTARAECPAPARGVLPVHESAIRSKSDAHVVDGLWISGVNPGPEVSIDHQSFENRS